MNVKIILADVVVSVTITKSQHGTKPK